MSINTLGEGNMNFEINTTSRLPLYQQLAHQIREAIARGDLQPEARLPSVRQLSQELVINPNTVARTELERQGLLVSQLGRGIFVAQPHTELTKGARQRRVAELLNRWLTEAVHLGYSAEEVIELVTEQVEQFQWNGARAR
jgi:GntR family transcriptional regulator